METTETEKERIYKAYSNWKRSCIFGWVESLWGSYCRESPHFSFTEFVRDKNEWKSLEAAVFQIKIWKEVKEERSTKIIK